MDYITQALRSLLPNQSWKLNGIPSNEQEFVSLFEIVTGIDDERNAIYSTNQSDFGVTWLEITNEISRLEKEYEANQYQRDRASEYPSIVDQLDLLYHEGYDGWKSAIQAVKDKYPKG